MSTKIHDGHRLDFIAPYDIQVDDPVLIGNIFGVSFNTVSRGDLVAIDTVGVHELNKDPLMSFRMGDDAYFHIDKKQIVNAPDGLKTHPVGYITSNEDVKSGKCFVRLIPRYDGLSADKYLIVKHNAMVRAGDALVINDLFCVATHYAKSDEPLRVKVDGLGEFPKVNTAAVNTGAKAHYHKTDKVFVATSDPANTIEVGYFVEDEALESETCKVRFRA